MSLEIEDTIRCKRGEVGYDINFTVKNNAGTAFDLTGYTITFKTWREGIPGTLIINGTGSIVVAASGTCKYTVVEGNTATPGEYLAELELTKTGVNVAPITYRFIVEESG